MRRTNNFIPVIALALAGAGLATWINHDGAEYKPRTEQFDYYAATTGKGFSGAAAWRKLVAANQETGTITLDHIREAEAQVKLLAQSKSRGALNLSWQEMGPMNVGGRTRAFLIDSVRNRFYTGGVSGGLWYSDDEAGTWKKINDHAENLSVSSITRAVNGDIYYGTGEGFAQPSGIVFNSGMLGRGIFKSTDGITFTQIPSTNPTNGNNSGEEWAYVTRVVAHPTSASTIYAGTNRGLRVTTDGGATWANDYITTTTGIAIIGKVDDIELASDGGFLVSVNKRVYYSSNGASGTFTDITPSIGGSNRVETAIAPSDPSVFYLSVSNNQGRLGGVWLTEDKGANWTKIGQGTQPNPPGSGIFTFEPFGENGQGWYDNTAYVNPGNAGEFYLGGVELWRWKKVNLNPVSGQWTKISYEFPDSPTNPFYVHSDKHDILASNESNNILYIQTDGGIFATYNRGNTYVPKNRDYNVTQFYSVAMSGTGEIIGGTQDNGTQYIDPTISLDAREVTGGDGGYADISIINNNILFSSIYYGAIFRSEDRGLNMTSFNSPGLDTIINNFGGSFVTPIRLWESFNDPLSPDSVYYFNRTGSTQTAGSQVTVLSGTANYPYTATLPITLNDGDSVLMRDPVQAQLALGLTNSVWLCVNPLNLNDAPAWVRIANASGTIQPMRFTKDGNTMFFGTQSGAVYRVTGLSKLRTYDATPHSTAPIDTSIKTTLIGSFGRPVNDIDVDPNNSNHIIAVLGNYGNTVYVQRATNAMTATGTANWTSKQGAGATALPKMPVYSVVIDRTDGDRVILGTEYGVYSTANIAAGAPTWTDENTNFPRVPTYMIRQQVMDNNWDQRILNSGCMYAGTHGRGFWKTCTLGSPTVNVSEKPESPADMLRVYPNPAVNYTNTDIVLGKDQDITVRVYDLNGRLITSQQYGKLAAGNHKLTLNTQQIAAGTYLISVEGTAGFKKASKLSVLK